MKESDFKYSGIVIHTHCNETVITVIGEDADHGEKKVILNIVGIATHTQH